MAAFYWRRILLGLLVLTVIVGVPYGYLSFRYWSNPPRLTRNIAAELNAPVLAVPEAERAWPVYREALIKLAEEAPEAWRDDRRLNMRALAREADVAQYIKRNELTLQTVRDASKRKSLGHLLADRPTLDDLRLTRRFTKTYDWQKPVPLVAETPSENPHMMTVQIQPAGEIGDLTDALVIDALLAASSGDGNGAAQDLCTMIRIADHLREIPLLVNDIVSLRYFSQALKTWAWALESSPAAFTDAQLLEIERRALEFSGGQIRIRCDAEKATFDDLLQRIYTDDGNGDGFMFLPNVSLINEIRPDYSFTTLAIAPLKFGRMGSRRVAKETHTQVLDAIQAETTVPYWECRCDDYEAKRQALKDDKGLSLVWVMAPARSFHADVREVIQQRDAVVAVSSAERYRRARGDWPNELAQLVPEFISSVPRDELTGKPLGYYIRSDRPVFYSRGIDGRDDDGRPADMPPLPGNCGPQGWYWSFAHHLHEQLDGDLVLWPLPFEPLPKPVTSEEP